MNNHGTYPTLEEVEAADRTEIAWWINNLPGDGGDEAKYLIMQRCCQRLAEFILDPHRPRSKPRNRVVAAVKPLHEALTHAGVIKPKPQPKPQAPVVEPGYFKSLFS